jgi:hypothetical protein
VTGKLDDEAAPAWNKRNAGAGAHRYETAHVGDYSRHSGLPAAHSRTKIERSVTNGDAVARWVNAIKK